MKRRTVRVVTVGACVVGFVTSMWMLIVFNEVGAEGMLKFGAWVCAGYFAWAGAGAALED